MPFFKDEPMLRKVLFVIAGLDYTGPARVLSLLAAGLPRENVCLCVLGEPSPWCEDLQNQGIPIHILHRTGPLDLRSLLQLRKLISQHRSDIIHAWGFGAAWPVVLSGACRPSALILSAALPPRRHLSLAERWLLRRCGRVIAIGQAEADVYQALGVLPHRLAVVPPAVPLPPQSSPTATLPGLPEEARVLLAIGPIARHKGHHDAVWAFDILRCLYEDVHLVIVGGGPDEQRVRHFTRAIRLDQVVHFTGEVADLQGWLARASVVQVPCLRAGGRQAALEAMAAGRPVVASRLPALMEVIADGQTGYLVTPGDKMQLSRQTRILFDHPEIRQRMGETAQRQVAERFSPARLIESFVRNLERV
jgi:glycosyltransferase involved in cell wall biosynthesis